MSDSDSSHQEPALPRADAADVRATRRFFERSAANVHRADVLTREIERRMAERLAYVRIKPVRVLDAGSGPGASLPALGRRYPRASLVALDIACATLGIARRRRALAARVRDLLSGRSLHYVCGDFACLPFAARSFQLVWSNLALSWAADPLAVFREFRRTLDVGGLLMFSAYGPDTLKELRAAYAAVDGLPHTLGFIDMHDLGDMLVAAGFAQPVMDMEIVTLTYPDFDALTRDLRVSGQRNAAQGRRRSLSGKAAHRVMRAAYETMRRDGRLPATVEIIYGHAWRGEPRSTEDGRSIVRLDLKQRPAAAERR